MARVRLDQLNAMLKGLQDNSRVLSSIFREISDVVTSLNFATIMESRQIFREAAQAAREYDSVLRGLSQVQRQLNIEQERMATATRTRGRLTQPYALGGLSGRLGALQGAQKAELGLRDTDLAARVAAFTQSFGTSAEATSKAADFLQKYEFGLTDLKRVYIDPINQTKQFTFETGRQTGVVQQATFAFDRFNNLVGDSGTRFKGMTDMIARNITKVLQWAVAVGVVYGSLAKLRDMVDILGALDEKMSDIAITTSQSGAALSAHFEAASNAARVTGMRTQDVLDIYDDALRATAGITHETERYAAAGALLEDSLTLSRLTGMEVTSAMDSMLGALKQIEAATGDVVDSQDSLARTFDRGESVLGTWILASKQSRVSLADLAETFAITGAAAGAAGLDVAELTALTTVLAESTRKSAVEVGNSIRRMITTIQSETGIAALRRVGIAVEDLSGQMRDWDEIMGDIASRRRAGAITDAAFRQLTYALGGGPRGSADVQAVIETWDQVTAKAQIFGDTAAASAARQDALAAKSVTLKNAVNQLNNSFVELVETLGGDAGLLNSGRLILELLTGLVSGINEFVDILGPATTRLIALGAAMTLLTRYGPHLAEKFGGGAFLGALGGGYGQQSAAARGAFYGMIPGWVPGIGPQAELTRRIRKAGGGYDIGGQLSKGFLTPQMGIAGLYAASQFATEGPIEDRAIKFGTTIAGAIIGAMTPAGPIIGAAIGDAAGSAMLAALATHELRFGDVELMSPDQLAEGVASINQAIQESVGPHGIIDTWFQPSEMAKRAEEFKEIWLSETGGPEAARAFLVEQGVSMPTEFGMDRMTGLNQYMEQYVKYQDAQVKAGQETERMGMAVKNVRDRRSEDVAAIQEQIVKTGLASKIQKDMFGYLEKLVSGDITKSVYKDLKEGAEAMLDIGASTAEVYKSIDDIPIEEFATVFIEMMPEVREEFQQTAIEVTQLEDALAAAMVAGSAEAEMLKVRLELARKELQYMYEYGSAISADPFKFEMFVGLDMSEEEFRQTMEKAQVLLEEYASYLGVTPEEIMGSTEEWHAYFAGIFEPQNMPKGIFDYVVAEAEKAKKSIEDAFNLQRLKDIGPSMIPELERRVRYWENYLARIPGYSDQAETQDFNLILGDENWPHQITTTMEALRFAIEDLTEVEKKQLEGMWNIPEGATVMVPLQSLYYAPKGGGAGGEVPMLPPVDFGQPANKMDTAGDKMLMAADSFQKSSQFLAANPELSTARRYISGQEMSASEYYAANPELMAADRYASQRQLQDWADSIKPILKEPVDVTVEVPPIEANINISIPPITLNGERVSKAISIVQSRRLAGAARARGMAGGGVIQ